MSPTSTISVSPEEIAGLPHELVHELRRPAYRRGRSPDQAAAKAPLVQPGQLLVVNLYYDHRDPIDLVVYHAERHGSLARDLLLVEVMSCAAKFCRVKRRPELDQGHACGPLKPIRRSTEFYIELRQIGNSARLVATVAEAETLNATWRRMANRVLALFREAHAESNLFWLRDWNAVFPIITRTEGLPDGKNP